MQTQHNFPKQLSHENLNILGPTGILEAILQHANKSTPNSTAQDLNVPNMIGIICHPHPLYSGNMNNKVVTTIANSLNALKISCIRFNFRGVGKSEGTFGNVLGEIEDCIAIINWLQKQPQWQNYNILLIGFSFGAFIAANVAHQYYQQYKISQLLLIAPAVHLYNFATLEIKIPITIIQGKNDEIVPFKQVQQWYENLSTSNKNLILLNDTCHFFHGKLLELKEQIKNWYCT